MRRVLAVLVVAGVCIAAVVLTGASDEADSGTEYKMVFDNAFGLVEGGDFRVAGVKAGQTTDFAIVKNGRGAPKAEVTVKITVPGFDDFREDATCEVRPQSLIGEYFVDCQPGTSAKRLPKDGKGVIPVEQTVSTIPQDLINNVFRRPYRERFRLIVAELGTGLAGRPKDLQEVLRRAHPGLRETSKVLKILGDQNEIIQNFITDSDSVVTELAANKADVVRWVQSTADASEVTATRREELRQTISKLPRFLSELRPTMRELGNVADEQIPLLADVQRAAPDLNTFFDRLGPFAEASRPALRSLGDASERGTEAFRSGTQEVAELKALSKDAGPFAKPLRQFFETFDNRNRALETDQRAKDSAPPAPDPTAISGEGGFTGLEAVWNYAFWQTLSVNQFDAQGHILRLGLTINDCSNINNKPNDTAMIEKCNQWLGPYQPGITAPDFTTGGATSSKDVREAAETPAQRGERRSEGQPDAAPAPGQPDISKPQLALPPDLQKLVDGVKLPELTKELEKNLQQLPLGPNGQRVAPDRLLDFLLAP